MSAQRSNRPPSRQSGARSRLLLRGLSVLMAAALAVPWGPVSAVSAADPTPDPSTTVAPSARPAGPKVALAPLDASNPIVTENALPGNPPSEWDVSGAGDPGIQGFATNISVNHGTTVDFKIDTLSSAYHIDIYRLGYYGGDGARRGATISPSAPLPQLHRARPLRRNDSINP